MINQQDPIALIREEVKTKGYSCQSKFNEDIDGLNSIELPLYINVSKDPDVFPYKYISLDYEQEPWFKILHFDEYQPTYQPTYEDIEHADDDGFVTKWIMVYFKELSCPPEGSLFDEIDDDGQVNTWKVKNEN
jgi:hypothetical protein